MNIAEAKQQVKDTVSAYLARDEFGDYRIEPARQRPLFLIGAPGIGKTAIMEQVAQELGIGLISYSMTHHTRQSLLGLPFIVHKEFDGAAYDASEYTMSEIIVAMYDFMTTTGVRSGILFLDEVNCVSETLYPSMLQFLQFKTFGRHRVPDGWVIVTAGNPPEYNKSVHEFDIVTLDRLRKIDIAADYDAWKAYAHDTDVHPAITTFLEIHKECFYSVETKIGGKCFVTARGWSDLSDLITLYEDTGKTIDDNLIVQYIQDDEIASRFALYYDLFNKYKSDYQVDRIMAGEVDESIVTRASSAAFDEKLSLLGLILDAIGSDMKDVFRHEDALIELRDVLRIAKEPVVESATSGEAMSVLAAFASHENDALIAGTKANTMTPARRYNLQVAVRNLRHLEAEVARSDAKTGQDSFDIIQDWFRNETGALEPAVHDVEMKLGNIFDFIERAFGHDQELLIFVTELTSRKNCSRFINRYGSESYFAHNEEILVHKHQNDLSARIRDLGIGE